MMNQENKNAGRGKKQILFLLSCVPDSPLPLSHPGFLTSKFSLFSLSLLSVGVDLVEMQRCDGR